MDDEQIMLKIFRIKKAGRFLARIRYRCPQSDINGIYDILCDSNFESQRVWLLKAPGASAVMHVDFELRDVDGANMRIECLVKLPTMIVADASGIALLSTQSS